MAPAKWTIKGTCALPENHDKAALFFSPELEDRYAARNLCGDCPNRRRCLTYALENRQIWGVWGGLDEGELRRVLSVNANGTQVERSRPPSCPWCKARASCLYVTSSCRIDGPGVTERSVECSQCGYTWRSGTSVNAVLQYWTERRRQLREKRKA